MTEGMSLSLAVAILDVNLKGPTATFDERGLMAVRSAWLAVRAHLDTERSARPREDSQASLTALWAEVEEVLRPFASAASIQRTYAKGLSAEDIAICESDDYHCAGLFTNAQVRRAAALLSKLEERL